MKKYKHIILIIFLSLLLVEGFANDISGITFPKKGDKREKLSWIFGLGWNIVDDNGSPFKKLFAAKSSWSIPFYPSQLSAEVIRKHGLSYGATFCFNRYKSGKLINSEIIGGRYFFFSWDAFAKYHLNEHITTMKKQYDPYFLLGAGYTLRFIRPYNSTFTFNVGAGVNIWFTEKWGINLQTIGKIGVRSPFLRNGSNYMHHSFSVVYIIDNSPEKKYSKIKPRYKWVHDKHNLGEK